MILTIFLCSLLAVTSSGLEYNIVSDYPELKPLVELVGEEDLSVMHLLGFRVADEAMRLLPFSRGSAAVLTITNAGYPVIETDTAGWPETYFTTEGAIDGILVTTGHTPGQGNLLIPQSCIYTPLWFAFFDKNTGECVYIFRGQPGCSQDLLG